VSGTSKENVAMRSTVGFCTGAFLALWLAAAGGVRAGETGNASEAKKSVSGRAAARMAGIRRCARARQEGEQARHRRLLHQLVRLVQSHGPQHLRGFRHRCLPDEPLRVVARQRRVRQAFQGRGGHQVGRRSGARVRRQLVPITWFIQPDGKPLDKLSGYIPPDRFRKALEYVHERTYEKKQH
jgi:hypothetical protein